MNKIDHSYDYKIFHSESNPKTKFEIGSQKYYDYYIPKTKKENIDK